MMSCHALVGGAIVPYRPTDRPIGEGDYILCRFGFAVVTMAREYIHIVHARGYGYLIDSSELIRL